MTTFTHKIKNLYVAYAPEFEVAAYGVCRDEALNNLTDELRQLQDTAEATGEGGNNAFS
jgi:hypothetical protein